MENGLGEEIDWRGVKEDLVHIGIGFDNADRFEIKADYLASRLRESFSSYKAEFGDQKSEKVSFDEQVPYSARDLSFAGVYARSLSEQLKGPDMVWNPEQSDYELGKFLAARAVSEQKKIANADIGDKLSNMLHTVFEPFMEKFLDALDHSIDEQKALISGKPWMSGLIRTGHIDRDCVCSPRGILSWDLICHLLASNILE